MKKILFLITILLLMGCKSKKVIKETETKKEIVKTSISKDSIQKSDKVQEKKLNVIAEKKEQKKNYETEITIKGKAEENKPLEFHNVKDGDTLQSIRISGNAEVFIHSKNSNSEKVNSEKNSETLTEKFKEFSQKIVEENNVKERVSETKKRLQDTTTKTGTFWSFGLFSILGSVAIVIIGLIIYLKK